MMIKRIWKRFKGSPKKTPTSAASSHSVEQKCDEDPNNHVHEADDSSSASSTSSVDDALYRDLSNFTLAAAAQEKSAPIVPKFDLTELALTHFPEFESVPDGELTESSDDESVLREKEKKFSSKEDEDVQVFLCLAKQMSLKSLLHLLQGHVKALNHSDAYLNQYNAAISSQDKHVDSVSKKSGVAKKPLEKTQKQFRWAIVTGDKVRAVVHEVDSYKKDKNLWWQPMEMHMIRAELVEAVRFFRKHRKKYISAVEAVARGAGDEATIDAQMKILTEDSYARGLETHIVRMLSEHRKLTVQSILEEQKECRMCNDDEDTTRHCLREQSLAYSQLSCKFARRMGRCDHVEALKCNMSKWAT